MESSAIRIVRADGFLIMGILGANNLDSPRVLEIGQGPNGQVGVKFLQFIGQPKSIVLGNLAFSYECLDENIIRGYRESVTGLSLANKLPANVSQIGMLRNQ